MTHHQNSTARTTQAIRHLLLLLCLWASTIAAAQNTQPDTASQKQQPRGIVEDTDEHDTVSRRRVFFFQYKPQQVKIEHISHPTLDPTGAQFNSNPLDAFNGDYYLGKGLVGQSHLPLYLAPGDAFGWHYQPDINSGYAKTLTNIRFYQTQRPYTLLSYGSSLKKEYVVRATHTQNINPRWNIALDYQLINPDAIYSNSDVLNHYLDITTNYYSRDARYQAYGGIIWQKWRIGENGGLTDDNSFHSIRTFNPSGLPVNNYYATSRYNNIDLLLHQSYNFVAQVAQVKERSKIVIDTNDSTLLDTIYWNDTILPSPCRIANPGVVGLDLSMQRNARRYIDSTTSFRYSALLYWTNDAYPDQRWHNPLKLTIGIKPQIAHLGYYYATDTAHTALSQQQWLHDTTLLFASPMAHAVVMVGDDTLSAEGEITLGNGYNSGDRHLTADYALVIDTLRSLSVHASLSAHSPDYFYYHYHANNQCWDTNGLQKQTVQHIQIAYRHRQWMNIELSARHVGNCIHLAYGSDGKSLHPEQINGEAWLLQSRLKLRQRLWGWFHIDMQHLIQYSSDQDQLRVPLFATKNSVYADVNIFRKALRLQTGIDIRYHTAFHADAYCPEVGAFVQQNSITVGNYLWGDIFVNLQIKRATIYLKAGHLNSLWEQHPDYFLLPHYPGDKFGFYYGIIWKFFD